MLIPGYGATPLATGRSYDDQARVLAATPDALSIERAVALGVSAGAPSCVAFASMFPSRCQALVLCGALAPRLASTRGMVAAEIPGAVHIWAMLEARRRRSALRSAADLERYLASQLGNAELIRARQPAVARDLRDFIRWTSEAPSGTDGLLNAIRNIRSAHQAPRRRPGWPSQRSCSTATKTTSCPWRTRMTKRRPCRTRAFRSYAAAHISSCRLSARRPPSS
jgi:pimeloyl-ACP methyl ester carboxylesterase